MTRGHNRGVLCVLRSAWVALVLLATFLCSAQTPLGGSAPSRPFVPDNRWALVIGVSGYSDEIGALRYTAKEAHEFADALTTDLAFDRENVRLLADGGHSPVAPTSANILSALDSLLTDKRLDKGNLFVFYFSGHGVATPRGDYLLPADVRKGEYEAKGVPVREVIRRVVGAGLKNVLFITDACRAGTSNDFGQDLSELCHQANLAVILGCAPGKRSYEYDELGRGAFTNSLLDALKRPDLRDVSGALWASGLGEDVRTRTHDYTLPDKGERNAQTPTVWAERSTLDVLLGAYPKADVTDEAVRLFTARAEKLGRKEYGAAMVTYAKALFNTRREQEAVTILKTVDALGESTPESKLTLGFFLETGGRTGEAQRIFDAFEAMPEGYYRNLALAYSSSRGVDPARRLKAAIDLFDEDKRWNPRLFAFWLIKARGGGRLSAPYAGQLVDGARTPRERAFATGELRLVQARWKEALAAFEESRKSPGGSPSDYDVYFEEGEAIKRTDDPKALRAYLDLGATIPEAAGKALIQRAQAAKDRNEGDAEIADLRVALTRDLTPENLWLAANVAGFRIARLADEFRAAAERHPYSWRALLVLICLDEIQGKDKVAHSQAIERYLDDRLVFDLNAYEFMSGYMAEAIDNGQSNWNFYNAKIGSFFCSLREQSDRFGYDEPFWMAFLRYGMSGSRYVEVAQTVRERLSFAPPAIPADLRPIRLLAAMNLGRAEEAREIAKGAYLPEMENEMVWRYAAFLASTGATREALRLTSGLAAPHGGHAPIAYALRTYLLAASGDLPAARKRLRETNANLVGRALDGLAWAILGDWAKAEPLLAEQNDSRDWAYAYVQEFALRSLDARYRATGRIDAARNVAYMVSAGQPGNPLFRRYSFATRPEVAAYAGTVALAGQSVDDVFEDLRGPLAWKATKKGVFALSFTPNKGDALRFQGSIDAYGNVSGVGGWHGRRYVLTGKVAPPSLYRNMGRFRKEGQFLQLIDATGARVLLVGKA